MMLAYRLLRLVENHSEAVAAGLLGKPIIAISSSAKDDKISRIVPMLSPGAGVVTSRGLVRYVVTEYVVAYLHGKTIRERARALIDIAYPKFREELHQFCEESKWLQRPLAAHTAATR